MLTQEEIRERMTLEFEAGAVHLGTFVPLEGLMESLTHITFGTALGWAMEMSEEEIQDAVLEAARFVHRENPMQFAAFMQGWEALG
jgi:hypothetical protein